MDPIYDRAAFEKIFKISNIEWVDNNYSLIVEMEIDNDSRIIIPLWIYTIPRAAIYWICQ